MSTKNPPKGVRLREFSPIVDRTYNSFRTLLQTDRIPFDPADKGERLLYTAEHAIAVAAADLMVRASRVSFEVASERIVESNAVGVWFSEYSPAFDRRSIRLVTFGTSDASDRGHIFPQSEVVTRLERLVQILDGPSLINLSILQVAKAVDLATELAVSVGYELQGRDLVKREI